MIFKIRPVSKQFLANQFMPGDFLDHTIDHQSIFDASLSAEDITDSETEPLPKVVWDFLLCQSGMKERDASKLPIITDGKNSFRRTVP